MNASSKLESRSIPLLKCSVWCENLIKSAWRTVWTWCDLSQRMLCRRTMQLKRKTRTKKSALKENSPWSNFLSNFIHFKLKVLKSFPSWMFMTFPPSEYREKELLLIVHIFCSALTFFVTFYWHLEHPCTTLHDAKDCRSF